APTVITAPPPARSRSAHTTGPPDNRRRWRFPLPIDPDRRDRNPTTETVPRSSPPIPSATTEDTCRGRPPPPAEQVRDRTDVGAHSFATPPESSFRAVSILTAKPSGVQQVVGLPPIKTAYGCGRARGPRPTTAAQRRPARALRPAY